ncbi:unnamed protein product [Rhodiola kirilowii]
MSSTPVELRFTEFYNKWVSQLEQLHHELLQAATTTSSDANQHELQALISKATTHFKEYYTVKWAAAHEDILAFYAPKWLTPLENAHFWFTGFKPTTVFKLVDKLKLTDLTEAQMKGIKELKLKVKMEEDKVESEMERQQVGVADWKMVELARMTSRVKADQSGHVGRKVDGMSQVAVSRILGGAEKVMKAGDCVRLKAMKSVLDVLTPRQSVEFLAAIALVHVQLRKEGLKIHQTFRI